MEVCRRLGVVACRFGSRRRVAQSVCSVDCVISSCFIPVSGAEFTTVFYMGQSQGKMASNLLHDVNVATKKATFGMGCFWGPDSLYGAMKGIVRTRVGYSGGSKIGPTYRSIGDHTEAIDLDYNPDEVTYNEIIQEFWANHDPSAKNKAQYTSLIFYHDEEQKKIAEETLKIYESKHGRYVVTKVIPFKEFYDAEDYHQKYRLQQHSFLMDAIGLRKGSMLKSSHLAARLNGYVVGFGGVQQFDEEVSRLGLDEKTAAYVRKLVVKYEGHGMTC